MQWVNFVLLCYAFLWAATCHKLYRLQYGCQSYWENILFPFFWTEGRVPLLSVESSSVTQPVSVLAWLRSRRASIHANSISFALQKRSALTTESFSFTCDTCPTGTSHHNIFTLYLKKYSSGDHSRIGWVALKSPKEDPLRIAGARFAACPFCHLTNKVKAMKEEIN